MFDSSDINLSYLDFKKFSDESVRAALLVTDTRTRPLEFRVTSPIKPTTMQRILYGKALNTSVHNDLLGLPLLTKSAQTISIVFIKNPSLLKIRQEVGFPIVAVKDGSTISEDDANREDIFQNIQFELHLGFESERDFVLNVMRHVIVELGLDLFDPFERLQIALNEVHAFKPEKPSS